MGAGVMGNGGNNGWGVVGCNVGAVHVEIPAASAGMTEKGSGYGGEECEGG